MIRRTILATVLLAFLGILALYQHLAGPPIVYFVNSAPVTLDEVVITTSGGVRSLGSVSPGDTRCCFVAVRGESGLAVSFAANSHRVTEQDLAYLESSAGSCEVLEVDEDLSVTSTFKGSGCGLSRFVSCRLTRRCS